MVSKMTSLERTTKASKTTVSKDGDVHQLKIDQETAMRKFRKRQRSISVKTIDSQWEGDHTIPGTNFASKSRSSPWNKHGNIKRPMNAFMLFGRAYRPVMVQMFPGAPNSQMSIYLGNTWRSMTWDQQKPFFEEAKRIQYRHQNDYPERLYERENQRSIKYIKKLREDYMVPRNQVFLPGDDQTPTQLCPSISVSAPGAQVLFNSAQEVTDLLPEITPISPGEMYNEGDLQNLNTPNVTHNNVEFTDTDYEVGSMEGKIQLGDQASFDLQELWNLVEGNSPPTQNVNAQDCAEALMKMCDYDVRSESSFDGSTTSQLGDQQSLDLQDLWNLVENSSPPPPQTQIVHSQDRESCTWPDVPYENIVSIGAFTEVLSSSMVLMNNPIEYTGGPTSWPAAIDDCTCHVIHNNEHRMETFSEHSVELVVSDSPETIIASGRRSSESEQQQ